MEQIRNHDTEESSIVVTDEYFIGIMKALMNLTPPWSEKMKNGSLKLPLAVQIGTRLDHVQQGRLLEWQQDTYVPEKYRGKVVHAFSSNMPEWSIHCVLRIYKLAESTKAAIIIYNDLMDRFDEVVQQFEYDFLENELPTDDELLEQALDHVETKLQHLYNQASLHKRQHYNRYYGDSSTLSSEHSMDQSEESFRMLIGVNREAGAEEVRLQSRRLLKKLHPDQGGSAYLFDWVKKAYDAYLKQEK